jgi:hypothetical protein
MRGNTAQHTPHTAQHTAQHTRNALHHSKAHPTTPHHSTPRHTQHSTTGAQRTHTHPTQAQHRQRTKHRVCTAQATQRNAQHTPAQPTHSAAQHTLALPVCVPVLVCLCLSVCLCVCVCGLCVRVLSYSDSKCFCAVFCAVFRVCVLFLVNFNCLLFQLFACLFAQRARFVVTMCADCDSLCFVTDSPTHNPHTHT